MPTEENRRVSTLERDLDELMQSAERNGAIAYIRQVMQQMDQQEKKRVVVTSYPACNSVP